MLAVLRRANLRKISSLEEISFWREKCEDLEEQIKTMKRNASAEVKKKAKTKASLVGSALRIRDEI